MAVGCWYPEGVHWIAAVDACVRGECAMGSMTLSGRRALRGLEGASYEGLGRTEAEFSPHGRAGQGSCEGYCVHTLGWHWASTCSLERPTAADDARRRRPRTQNRPRSPSFTQTGSTRSHPPLTSHHRLLTASPLFSLLSARPGAEPRAVSKERAGLPRRPLSAATLVTLRRFGRPAHQTNRSIHASILRLPSRHCL